ncbi:MAG: esterase family protein [Bacteroidetes bacterium]|nr:esterase family protein [Bacteroidota bacterium]
MRATYSEETISAYSSLLNREVTVTVLLPPDYSAGNTKFPLLILNDGQDMKALNLKQTIEELTSVSEVEHVIVAGVVAGDRLQEYGVAAQRDYLKRGRSAKAYTKYITTELIPYLIYKFPVDADANRHAIAGCSMGGLSAIDIAWNHPELFRRVGVFSGSFWWRKRDSASRFYSDHRDRLMHRQVRNGRKKEGLKFWFQTGTLDEQSDRNKNGVIDSIDDTLDLIVELVKKNYRPFYDIHYHEVKEGHHDIKTWAEAFPEFLKWAFGK